MYMSPDSVVMHVVFITDDGSMDMSELEAELDSLVHEDGIADAHGKQFAFFPTTPVSTLMNINGHLFVSLCGYHHY